MRKIKEKLHSENGASFLFALVAFLVAAMVSVTIVAAAVSSLKRVYSDRAVQQAHLTLTSAAQLVRDEMEKTKYVTEEVVVKKDVGKPTTTTTITVYTEGTFGPEMQDAVSYVDTGFPYNGSGIRLEVQGLEMEPVDISFTMKAEDGESSEKYKVIFTFTLVDADETLFLTMDGVVGTPVVTTISQGNKTTTTTTTTITWSLPIINGIGA